jgi:hypothetical protein
MSQLKSMLAKAPRQPRPTAYALVSARLELPCLDAFGEYFLCQLNVIRY